MRSYASIIQHIVACVKRFASIMCLIHTYFSLYLQVGLHAVPRFLQT
jgi:hypothetical protein